MQPIADDAPLPRVWPDFVEVGLIAAAVMTTVEMVLLGSASLGLLYVVASLLGAVGLFIGLTIEGLEWVVRRRGFRGMRAASVRALGTLLISVPIARTLFDGSFASTLPGASWAPLWLPLLGVAATTVALHYAGVSGSSPRRHRVVFGGSLAAAAFLTELVNRNVKSSELPDLHTGLVMVTMVGLVLSLRCLVEPVPASPRTRRVRLVLIGFTLVGATLALKFGLRDADDRWTIATNGTHARLMVRAARGLVDMDGDGFSSALGGADCDDGDPSRHPAAVEIPGNDIDENCDGYAAADDPNAQAREEARADLETWMKTDGVRNFLDTTRKHDVILIAVDALRADMLAPTEQNQGQFPNLTGLAAQSVRFDLAFSPAAGTDLSMSTILTGRINPFSGIDQTLAEAMKASGRTTHGVIPSEVLRYAGKTLLTRGLDDHDRLVNDRFEKDVGNYSTSARATELALRWVDETADDSPGFLWVHYFDVHEHAQLDRAKLRRGTGVEKLDTTQDRYRASVQLVDIAVGELIDGLRERGRLDHTIIALVSDHGESLGEDERLPQNHGLFVYNPLVHVPFAIRIPGVAPRSSKVPVSLLDVGPTLAQLSGAQLPDVDGTSLLAQLMPDAPPELRDSGRPVVLNESEQRGIVVWPYKLMQRPGDNLTELYDLDADFAETKNLAAADPQRVGELLSVYYAYPSVELDRTRRGRRARERAAEAPGENTGD